MRNLTATARTLGARACADDRVFHVLDRARARWRGGVILAFHDLPTVAFGDQVKALGTYRVVSLTELVNRHRASKPTGGLLAITFDDGVRDVTHAAAKLAVANQWPITFYLPTHYLDDPQALAFHAWIRLRDTLPRAVLRLTSGEHDLREQAGVDRFITEMTSLLYESRNGEFLPRVRELREYMVENGQITDAALVHPAPISWDEVATLSRDPLVSFESHSVSHQPLARLSADEIETELRDSQRRITDCTSVPCRHFCYPYGSLATIGTAAPRTVSKYYDSGVTMVRGRVGGDEPELLSRVPIYTPDTPSVTRLKVVTA